MKMTNPELKVVRFENEDVIATSMFIIEDDQSSTGFSIFEGSMYGPVEEGTWAVGTSGWKNDISQDEINDIRTAQNGYYYSWYGEPVYDAYETGDGYIYTKGASYYDLYGNH